MRAFPAPSVKSNLSLASCFLLAVVLSATFAARASAQDNTAALQPAPRPLITQAIDEARLTVLKGNTHRLARPAFDLGTAPASLPMERMLLVLKRSDEQETALRRLLDDQQDRNSPRYHKWLTPEHFGAQFGPTDTDLQIITSWLQSHGFQVGTTKGRTMLEFSGSASQVQEAFHTTIHKYIVNGEQHWANASDPSIPAALTPAVKGVLTLHNFISKPMSHPLKEPVLAQIVDSEGKRYVTFPGQGGGAATNALEPQDFAVIYNLLPAYNTVAGAGVTIGVVGRNDLYNDGQDIQNFRQQVGAGNNSFAGANLNVIVSGPDPGNAGGGEEFEATLDATWSGAIAPNATVDFVISGGTNTTDGIDLSELYIIENNLADIMTESFGSCEYVQTDARLQGLSALAEQAAAQGITYFVSTGDNGAEGCDDPNTPPAAGPVSVSALASTAFNVAVGGTMFNENGNPSKYWLSTAPLSETAISYIPENVWNESSLTNGLWSGSGGASAGNIGNGGTTGGVPKPTWQSGTGLGIPQDGVRDLPDVSLTSAIHDPYILCMEASCVPNSQNQLYVYFIGGTSAATPSFAGIMALVDQSAGGRQGQANYVFYQLAAKQAAAAIYPGSCNASNTAAAPASNCIFNDVTVGNNVVPGEVGNQYQAQAGFDLATGLGSVNVANLISNWSSVTFSPTTTTFTLKGAKNAVTITHGQSVAVGSTVTPNSGTKTPTGDVVLYTSNGLAPSTLDLYPLNAAGQASGSTSSLPGSSGTSINVWAHYGGDGTFAPSDSNQISVTVNPESSTTTLSLTASTVTGGTVTSPYPFGSLVFVQADVASTTGGSLGCQAPKFNGCPTGTVTFTDTFGPLPTTNAQVNPPVAVVNNPSVNSQGNTSIGDGIISFDAGNHTISASYSGDPSFSTSSSGTPVSFSVQPGFVVVSGPSDVSITAPGLSGNTTVGIIASSNFTTPIAFTCSGLPTETTCGSASATGQGPSTVVPANITVTTTAPHTVLLHTNDRRYYFAVLLGGSLPFGIFFVAATRRRRWNGIAVLMLLVALVMVPACGGGGGSSHHQDPGTPAGSYTVTVTASAGGITQQGTFTLVVQ